MTQFLPPNLLALFAPRDPIPFLPQLEKLPHEKHHNQPYSGIAPFIRHFEDPRDAPPPTRAETREERLERKRREKIERRQGEVETELKLWDPHNDPNAQGDAFKTLFVARVNYDTTESKLRREFEVYGPIKRIYIVYNKRTGKPRGYAFIEYEHERDMHSAYKHADGKKIDGRRVLVDVERGRTVKGWLPRRLGGGLGGTRRGGADVNIKHSGRDDASRYDDRPLGGDRDRGERRERSRERDRDKDRERRRSRSRERRRHMRSQDRDRDREKQIGEDGASSRRRERERDRGGAGGGSSRSRERSRDRKRRSRSRDRKRDRERGKGLDGEEGAQGDGVPEPGERIPEEQEGEAGEGGDDRRDRERDRDRRRSHRDRDRRRGERDRDREHKRDRGDRDRGERREERHGSAREEVALQGDGGNEEDGGPTHMEEYSQDAMMDQQMVPSVDGYGSENGFKMEPVGEEY
ncbi:U1 small nuclear ribonucleoprotein 70 kDa [Oryzias melastigma]|uniref:U1 small nuclear ribonucleoprotein 70 kDa n=1 Tax=Oryzias melastigma TaxID=30732 RepID=A0A3B3C2Y3_ORYME|nr:U1 small nuclear ribonucleoprotein 70 kDa [Oryzias melastigma]XP_024127325.1 U1 small nuclear ribonucleoprotein 70 kDa [Oryzias melastigma]KAF6719823.1 U1 small nuclear ribonucleoprotein 70 kDa [Oryzias melastigma]